MLKLLKRLSLPVCVSGDEPSGQAALEELLAPLGQVSALANGTVLCRLPAKRAGLPVVMLTAHLDRIGMMVTRIAKNGFIRASAVGGVDRRSLAGARVTIHTKSGDLPGVVCATPPHLSSGNEGLPDAADTAIDAGLPYEKAKSLVGYGDRVTFDGEFTPLLGDRVCAPALDDRAGCAVVIRAAESLRDNDRAEIVLALAAQEEVGSAGAATAAFSVSPDYCFAVDVTFASTPDSDPSLVMELGKGPAVGYAPILDRRLSALLADCAARHGIPYQAEVMAGRTGTDADVIAVSGKGVRTALLSVPERYMHTAGEVVSLTDLENTARLLAETIGGAL